MIKKIVIVFVVIIIFLNIVPNVIYAQKNNPSINYQSHLKDYGWIDYSKDGMQNGTTGECRRMEALKIWITDLEDYKLSYQVHVKDYGWLNVNNENEVAGTTGECRRLEAVIINFQNDLYTIKYRVHVENLGWLDWVENGQVAGTTGLCLRAEAIEIVLVKKNTEIIKPVYRGIDVSKYQGDIDWKKVKNSFIDYAMIRIGYRGYEKGTLQEDSYFKRNVENAYNAGLRVGLYYYSSAINENEAIEEANYIINKLNTYNFNQKITYPIAFDYENDFSSARNYNLSKDQNTKNCRAFCRTIKQAGYEPIIYSYTYFLENKINMNELQEYDTWIAHYTNKTSYPNKYTMWQYTSNGIVDGIGTNVDMNYCYKKY